MNHTSTWAAVANVWFVAWAIRYKAELDRDMDSEAKILRWFVAIGCLALAINFPQFVNSPELRMTIGFIGVAFLAWPNFAYHLTAFLRTIHVLPSGAPRSRI